MESKNAFWTAVLGTLLFVLIIGAAKSPSFGKFGPTKYPSGFYNPKLFDGGGTAGSGSGSKTSSSTTKKPPVVKKGPMQVVFPNGGEVWERGKQYNVRWNTDLSSSISIVAVLFPTDAVVSDPYATNPGTIAGVEMFTKPLINKKFNDGSYSYRVPDTLAPGPYQVLIWGGERCSPTNTTKKCPFDLSDGLITIQ
jgi:hypothetical protein